MAQPVYFDTSIFLEILSKNSKHAAQLKELIQELKREKIRIYTSILTIQEANVFTFRRGKVAYDNHAEISKLCRIYGMDKLIALTAAKREAEIRDKFNEKPDESEAKQRRRWDCIHIATAQVLECSRLFTTDPGMMARKKQLSLDGIEIIPPRVTAPQLNFSPNAIALVSPFIPK